MPVWLEVILEIIKITVPALIVFFTVQSLLTQYLDKQYQLRQLELRRTQQDTTVPLRLQAYERLTLFCERIAIPNLVLRLRSEEATAANLRMAMLVAIQQEFEHNITQQVYVSDQLWQIIQLAQNEVVSVINIVSENVDPKADAQVFSQALFDFLEEKEIKALDTARAAIRKEASLLL